MDKKAVINIIREFVKVVSKDFKIEKIILFGSHATGKAREDSDIDLIIVSDDFEGTKSYKRAAQMYHYWNFLTPVDFLCYTKSEFSELKRMITVVRQAVKEGIEI